MNNDSVLRGAFMELSLLVIFWYGILHAFGPDHLTAIADFSIGKNKKKDTPYYCTFCHRTRT
jgi:ABC-type nickel/cobalt efflux system permease component RcnA